MYISLAWTPLGGADPIALEGEILAAIESLKFVNYFTPYDGFFLANIKKNETRFQVQLLHDLLLAKCNGRFSYVISVTPAVPPAVFLEKAYFSLGTPSGKNLLFEGQPSVHYFLYNGLSNGEWQKNGGWRFAAPVSVLFLVRMTNTTSQPVLTPSYRIRPRRACGGSSRCRS